MEKQDENGLAQDQSVSSSSEEDSSELILTPTEAIDHKPTHVFTGSIHGQDDTPTPTTKQRSTYAMRSRRRQEFKEKCDVIQKGTITTLILYLSIVIAVIFTWISYNIWFIP